MPSSSSRTEPLPAACEQQYTAEESARLRLQLDRLLASSHFRASKRCRVLLEYVLERTLAGDLTAFKERTIGVAAFGRQPDYDTNQDPIVRATAGEVRKRLAQYYQEPGHEAEIKIVLLPGSYLPEFHFPAVSEPIAPLVEDAPKTRASRRWIVWSVAVLAIAGVAAVSLIRFTRPPLDLFWAGTINKSGILFSMGQPGAYNLRSDREQDELLEKLAHDRPSAGQTIPVSKLAPMPDRYIAVGDALALVKIAAYVQNRGATYTVRSSGATTFADLRDHPTVLIGAFNNDWTMRITSQLRFSFAKFYANGSETQYIQDREHPNTINWKLVNAWPDWNVANDYAVITRVTDPNTGGKTVIAAGITQFGTIAAGEFLSTPQYFADAARRMPANWSKKNLQIVIQAPVVHGSVGRPQVLATHVW